MFSRSQMCIQCLCILCTQESHLPLVRANAYLDELKLIKTPLLSGLCAGAVTAGVWDGE